MKLKNASTRGQGRRRKGRGTSLWNVLTGKWGRQHRLPAHVTGEPDWEVEVPQIRMSRAFAVMLVLHVVAVGGLFAFRIWGRDDKSKEPEPAVADAPATLVEPATPAIPPVAPSSSPDPTVSEPPAIAAGPTAGGEPLKTYKWGRGDTLPLVAARFGVTMTALRDANPDIPMAEGNEIVIPRAGRVIGGLETDTTGSKPAQIFDPSKTEIAAESIPPRARVIQDPPVETPAVTTPARDAKPVAVAHKVTAPPAAAAGTTTKPATGSKTADTGKKKPAASTTATKPAAESTPARTAGQRTHVVSKGDTVFNVAKRYGLSADDIAKANGLDSNYHIRPGQQLRIPVKR